MDTEIIYGVYIRNIWRNEKTGLTRFIIRINKSEYKTCEAVLAQYPTRIPIMLNGKNILNKDENKYIFYAEKVKASSVSEEYTQNFISSDEFKDIGTKLAYNIVQFTGPDIFAFAQKKDAADQLCKIKGISSNIAEKFIKKILKYNYFEELIDLIIHQGGNYFNASRLYEKYQDDAMSVMIANPYTLLYAGAPYGLCEAMAKKTGIESCDKKRVHAIVEHILTVNEKNGNTRISFHDLCQKVHYCEKKADAGYYTEPLFIADEILSDIYHAEVSDNVIYISFAKTNAAENTIAAELKRLIVSTVSLGKNKITVSEVEQLCNVHYSPEQANVIQYALAKSGVKIITGGPGTGKTTTLNGLLRKYELEHKDQKIVLCAPTGCAARKMSQATGREAKTIHKLLDLKPYENLNNIYRTKTIDAGCVVVDEMSMTDTELFAVLLTQIKNGTTLILLGDEDQLPSVGAGNVLADMIASGTIEVYRLKRNFRQMNGSSILDNAVKVISGDKNLKTDKSFLIKRFNSEEDMIKEAVRLSKKCMDMGKLNDMKLYAPARNIKFKTGTISLNRRIKEEIIGYKDESVTCGVYTFSVGDTVLFNKNNYEKNYYNGGEGVIRCIQKHTNGVHISVELDGEYIDLHSHEIEDIELAYAMTAHKSQGGECKYALIIIPENPASMLLRSLLYVEITRAKEQVMILSENNALEKAISTFREIKRVTGLKDKLIEALPQISFS